MVRVSEQGAFMEDKREEALKRVTETNPCGLTWRQRLRRWFWGTRVGVATNVLLGRSTAYKLTLKGTVMAGDNLLISDCIILPLEGCRPIEGRLFRVQVTNG